MNLDMKLVEGDTKELVDRIMELHPDLTPEQKEDKLTDLTDFIGTMEKVASVLSRFDDKEMAVIANVLTRATMRKMTEMFSEACEAFNGNEKGP